MSQSSNAIPKGVQMVADLYGVSAVDIWRGLQQTLKTQEQIDAFNQVVRETVAAKMPNDRDVVVAERAMAAAGDLLLGKDRPSAPETAAETLERAARAGIMKRAGS